MTGALHNQQEIVRLISEGDEQAFETFVIHYGPQVEKAIYSVVRTDVPVKDIMQETFLSIWISREKLATLDDPRTWLFRITYYRSYTWLRQQGKRTQLHTNLHKEEQRNPVEENSAFEETKRILHDAVTNLPQQMKKIYNMSREQNKSTAEIAEELGIAPQTVKNTLTTALKNIRTTLEQHGITIPIIILTLPFH